MGSYQLAKREGNKLSRGSNLSVFFEDFKGPRERWLFLAPHDDDLCLGAGLLMQKAKAEGVAISVVITSDGGMGFGRGTEKKDIQRVRKEETLSSFKILGIDNVVWLDFPDGSLSLFAGTREAKAGDPCVIQGHTGLQNAFTAKLREIRPDRVFVPAGSDLHPDHKIVHQEILISLFHASGDIWPQLGPELKQVPGIYEMAIYCDFVAPPTMQLLGSDEDFERKLESVLAYVSQQQIASLVENVRKSGPVEYFKPADFNLYVPATYNKLFD